MAHLASQELVTLFSLLAARDIEKDTKHVPIVKRGVVSNASRGYPANIVANHDAEVDFRNR